MKRWLLLLPLLACGCTVHTKTRPSNRPHKAPVTTPPVPAESEPRRPTYLYHFDLASGKQLKEKKTIPLPAGIEARWVVGYDRLSKALPVVRLHQAIRSDGQTIDQEMFHGTLDTVSGRLLPLQESQWVVGVSGERLFVSDGARCQCLHLPSLKPIWTLKPPLQFVQLDGDLFLARDKAKLVALDSRNGKLLWQSSLGEGQARVGGGAVLVKLADSSEVELDRKTGKVLAKLDLVGKAVQERTCAGTFFGYQGDFGVRAYAVGSLQPLWQRPQDDISSSICADSQHWYVQLSGSRRGVAALNWRSGKLDWCDSQAYGAEGNVLGGKLVLKPILFRGVDQGNGTIRSVPSKRCLQVRDPATGRILWYRLFDSTSLVAGEEGGQLWIWSPGKAGPLAHGVPPRQVP